MESSAGGNGTTDAISGANRAWASWSEAMTAFHNTDPGDAVTLYIIRGVGGKDTTGIIQPNVVTSPTRIFRVEVVDTEKGTPKWNNNGYILEVTNNHGFYNNIIDYLELIGIQIHIIETDVGAWEGIKLTNGNQHATNVYNLADRCFVRCTRTTGQTIGIDLGGLDVETRLGIARNCITDSFRSGVIGVGASSKFINHLSAKCEFNYVEEFASLFMNSYSFLPTSNGWAVTGVASCTNNGSDDSSAPGSNPQDGSASFIDHTNRDYRLAVADTICRGKGVSRPLYELTGDFTHDMKGIVRPSGVWAIGPDDGEGLIPPILYDQFPNIRIR